MIQPTPQAALSGSAARILHAAASCFGQAGYRGASMSRIAREAGVSKSLLHYHFETKERLFVEVQLTLMRRLLAQIRAAATGSSTVAQLSRALDACMDFVSADLDAMRVLVELHHVAQENAAIRVRLESFNAEINQLVEDGIRNIFGASAEHLFLPPARLARVLRTLFNGLILQLTFSRDDREARTLTREIFADMRALIARGLIQQEPS